MWCIAITVLLGFGVPATEPNAPGVGDPWSLIILANGESRPESMSH